MARLLPKLNKCILDMECTEKAYITRDESPAGKLCSPPSTATNDKHFTMGETLLHHDGSHLH